MTNRVRIVRVLGLEVVVHPGWLVAFVVVTASLALVVLPAGELAAPAPLTWAVAALITAFFFVSLLGHELAHALLERRLGAPVRRVSLFAVAGGQPLERSVDRPRDELLIAASGPLVSIAAAVASGAGAVVVDELAAGDAVLVSLFLWVATINAVLGLLNLIPAFPFDGGRILRAIAWGRRGDFEAATRAATGAGRRVGWLGVGIGLVVALWGDPLIGVTGMAIGWFLTRYASASTRWTTIQGLVTGLSVGDVMERDAPTVNPNLTLDVFVDQYVSSGRGTAFAVASGEDLIGTIDVDRVRRIARGTWPTRRVGEVMVRLAEVETARANDPLWPALERFERARLRLMPVVEGDRLLGVLTREGLMGTIRGRMRPAEP